MPAAKSAASAESSKKRVIRKKTGAAPKAEPAVSGTEAAVPEESTARAAAPASVKKPRAPVTKSLPATAAPAPATTGAAVPFPKDGLRKSDKPRLVRDSFTMPQADFDLVAVLKQRALGFQRPAKKSELLRAGLHALAALNDARLRAALEALQPLKPGRPKKGA
jgi:uncharacterized protein YkwD